MTALEGHKYNTDTLILTSELRLFRLDFFLDSNSYPFITTQARYADAVGGWRKGEGEIE